MDLTELFEAGKGLDDVSITLGEHQGAKLIGLQHYKDNIYYFTLDFTGTRIMPTEWEMCEKDATVTIKYKDEKIGSNENDWSYQNLRKDPDYDATSFAGLTPYIPVYDNGVLIFGEEPGGVTPAPSTKPTPTPTPTNPNIVYGDLDGNKEVNSVDYALLKGVLLGIIRTDVDMAAADLNLDGDVNSIDYALLKMYLLGQIKELPYKLP